MKAKQFEQKHGLGYNNAPYYKKIWKHLFPESDPHDYSNASLYLTYIHKLRNMVADTLVDKEPIDIYEFFGGKCKSSTCNQYISKSYMQQEKNTLRPTVVKRYENILDKFNVEYKHLKPKFKGLKDGKNTN